MKFLLVLKLFIIFQLICKYCSIFSPNFIQIIVKHISDLGNPHRPNQYSLSYLNRLLDNLPVNQTNEDNYLEQENYDKQDENDFEEEFAKLELASKAARNKVLYLLEQYSIQARHAKIDYDLFNDNETFSEDFDLSTTLTPDAESTIPILETTFTPTNLENETFENIQVERLKGLKGVPKITWQESCPACGSLEAQCLKIDFNDDQADTIDHICLEETAECIYQGEFVLETEASEVAVTKGCPVQDPGILEVSFQCDRVQGIRFECKLSNGDCHEPVLPEGVHDDFVINREIFDPDLQKPTRTSLPTLPSQGVIMDVVILYDDQFLNTLHSGNTCNAQKTINAIMVHVQNFFKLSSLGVTIIINIKRIDHKSGTFVAGNNIQ